jgi:hypothetical protein
LHIKKRVGKPKKTNNQINNNTKTGAKSRSLSHSVLSAANQLPLLSKSDPPKLKLTGKKKKNMQGEKCRKQRLKLIEIIQEEDEAEEAKEEVEVENWKLGRRRVKKLGNKTGYQIHTLTKLGIKSGTPNTHTFWADVKRRKLVST